MFDFDYYWSVAISFLTGNIFITIGIIAVLLFFLYKKTSETIKFLGFAVLLVAVLYIMSLLTESSTTGVLYKENETTKSIRELSE